PAAAASGYFSPVQSHRGSGGGKAKGTATTAALAPEAIQETKREPAASVLDARDKLSPEPALPTADDLENTLETVRSLQPADAAASATAAAAAHAHDDDVREEDVDDNELSFGGALTEERRAAAAATQRGRRGRR
ncbi:unnamed protein product, partial [Heterosigma akashiwo]